MKPEEITGLFRLDTALLKRRLGAPDNRPLADLLPTISIKAKDFAAEMTSVNVQQKDLHGQEQITREHVDNNTAVRKHAAATWNSARTTAPRRGYKEGGTPLEV